MERSYLEVKVSFLHIIILLGGIILIGSFLFYLGYQAGKSSTKGQSQQAELLDTETPAEEIQLSDTGPNTTKTGKTNTRKEPSIRDELKLHQLPVKTDGTNKKEPVQSKPIKKEPYFSVQVGAFSEYTNAKNYSAKFANMGYPTEILTTVKQNQKLFRVRVGNFKTRGAAQREKKKLEKMENKKFAVVKTN
jgi:cell division protein FtsN